jgi:outer membrane receptor protein involved in Fe transport
LTNYELGWKSTWLDKHLVWNGAMYYMPWKNYQSLLFDPGVCPSASFDANIGDARIYGMESNVKYQATSFLSMELSGSYNDSRITSDNFANQYFVVKPGERLPYVPYFNWSGNVRYERPLKDALHGYVQYDAAHKGDMFNSLQETGTNGLPYVLQPGYTLMNLRFGLNQTSEHWTAELYITNLTNKNAVIYTNEGNYDLRQTVNEPRVFGMRMSYRFGKAKAGGGGEE